MRVTLSPDVFSESGALLPVLMLLDCFASGRHEWHATQESIDAADAFLRENSPKIADTYVQLGQKSIVGEAWNVAHRARPVLVTGEELADAAHDLSRPAVLVVENATSDGKFIRALATVFRRSRVTESLTEDWLIITQSGGCGEIRATAENEAGRFRRHVRVVAFFDSDSLAPGQRTANHRAAEALTAAGLAAHVLALREAENYVPNRVLAESGSRRGETARKLTHLKALSCAQRGHFDMKKGFALKNHAVTVPTAQENLFAGTDSAVLRGLCGGFGSNLLELLVSQADRLTVDDFAQLSPDVEDEISTLLSMIEAVI